VALAHGRIEDAFAFNFFGPVLFALIALFVVAETARRLMGEPAFLRRRASGVTAVLVAIFAVWIGWGVVRAVTVAAS
jgi:hypothetical protein